MVRHALSPSCLLLVQCLERLLPDVVNRTGIDHCRIGLSGGADSLALTAAAAWISRRRPRSPLAKIRFTARIVDHGLQPAATEAAGEALAQAEALGITTEIVKTHVTRGTSGIEAAARDARYSCLEEGEDALILLGHTLDDQAETVLLGLSRGSGTRSLAGMPPIRGRLVRPLLSLRRRDTEQACMDWGLTWWNDPMNADRAYTRSRLRHAMGILEDALGHTVQENLARSADLCRMDADLLDQWALDTGLVSPQTTEISVRDAGELPAPIRHRVILRWLRQVGGDAVTRDHVIAVDALITNWHGQKAVSVPSGQIIRRDGQLHLDAKRA